MDLDARIRAHFDELAAGEWERLESSPRARVSLEVHRRFLADHLSDGARVLEIGAGPGRFTIALAQMGARVVVTDVSQVQLDLNRSHVEAAGHEASVESRYLLDVRELGRFEDDEFDLVLVYGGPLSYVFEDAGLALQQCMRVGRVILASVMSTLGAWRLHLAAVLELAREIGDETNTEILRTRDLRLDQTTSGHICQMYRASDIGRLVEGAGGVVLDMSTSNWASLGDEVALAELEASPERWAAFLAQEVEICRDPGILDAGAHILFAARAGI